MNRKITITSLKDDFGYYFKKYGISNSDLTKAYDKHQSVADFARSIFNKILNEIAVALKNDVINLESFYEKTSDTYGQMAYLLKLEGKDNRRIKGLEFENTVKHYELCFSDLIGIKIFSVNCCSECDAFHNKILTVSEALDFAKDTEFRCHPKYDNCNKCTLIAETKEDPNSPIKITFSVG